MHARPAHQFARYAAVGVLNTTITLLAYHGLLVAGMGYRVASAIGYTLGGLISYLANRAWTFAGHGGSHLRVGPRYGVVFGLGLLTDLLLITLLVEDAGLGKLLAQLLVAPVIAVQGFALARQWAFRPPPPPKPDPVETPSAV
jgi:putative flippase GtrA